MFLSYDFTKEFGSFMFVSGGRWCPRTESQRPIQTLGQRETERREMTSEEKKEMRDFSYPSEA
jgi:hypothetical protein